MAVLVTGASAGFGLAICTTLVKAGYKVIGTARRGDKLKALQQELGDNFCFVTMDLADEESIQQGMQQIPQDFTQIDLLVNNAGLALGNNNLAYECKLEDWQTTINVNINGLVSLTHKILPQMVARRQGHIINIGSIAGNYYYPGSNIYGATKAFVKNFSGNLRSDLFGCNVHISNIEPGLCEGTEFSEVRFEGDRSKIDDLYKGANALTAQDIADTVLWIYQRPKHVNINNIELMPVSQTTSRMVTYKE